MTKLPLAALASLIKWITPPNPSFRVLPLIVKLASLAEPPPRYQQASSVAQLAAIDDERACACGRVWIELHYAASGTDRAGAT